MAAATDACAQALEAYFAHLTHERRYSAHTVAGYSRDLRALLQGAGIGDWRELRAHHVRAHVARLHARGQATRSIQRALSSARAFLDYLVRRGQLTDNVARGIRAPKTQRKLPQTLDTDQAAQLLGAGDKSRDALRDQAMLELLYGSGLRLSELVGLDIGDVEKSCTS
jgi:integrase/recombinase XerC